MIAITEPIEISSINGKYLATFHSTLNELIQKLSIYRDCYALFDHNVALKYPELLEVFPKDRVIIIEANEDNKSLLKVGEISQWLIEKGATKSSYLIGVGGGVIQDLTTFVSHIYYRGIHWTYVPTTLLSQADSCIGAKCALNLNGHKNQLGVIHTPKSVEIYPGFLETLPHSEIESGFGEIAKLAVTGENQFIETLTDFLGDFGFSTSGITKIIRLSLIAKKFVIDQDEYESDLRRILNYGHSFGHALESLTNNKIVHGDAVVVGMDIINFIGFKKGITKPEFFQLMRSLFSNYFGHIELTGNIQPEVWVQELNKDKKMQFGKINFAIPIDVGLIQIFPMDLDETLVSLVGEYIESSQFFHTA